MKALLNCREARREWFDEEKLVLPDTAFLCDARGKTPKPKYTPNGMYILVPKTSERAEEVVKYLDWMSLPENIIRLQNGTEGETFEMDFTVASIEAGNRDGVVKARVLKPIESEIKPQRQGELP
ncbi:hypothetical protein ACF3MZ_23810 [Paenibacillaceae bacterium WGS1546]|uniref:hypothetical protein n=1 Tax=Cohnella sp. WGS1546 TaxID=3366810 RepID=UPI00372D4F99